MKKIILIPITLLTLSSCSLLNWLNKIAFSENTLTSESSEYTSETITSSTTLSTVPTSTNTSTNTTTNSTTSEEPGTWTLTNHGDDKLPIGNVYAPAPENIFNPTKLVSDYENSSWVNKEMFNSMPNNWAHIYGNNITNAKFYAESSGGGLKLDQQYKGFQSEAFNASSGKRIELRINISQVNDATGKGTLDTFGYIYFFDKYTNLLTNKTISINDGDIRPKDAGNYLRYYINDAENISYFEFRLASLAHYGTQNYNFGVDKVSIKLWPDNTK